MPATELVHKMFFHHGAIGTPTGPLSTPYYSTSEYRHLTFYVGVQNATTVTGTAITLTQAKDAAGTGAKALSFAKAYRVPNWGATPAADLKWEEFTVANDTFTSPNTNNLAIAYMIEIEDETLDRDNDFRFVRLNMASGANCTAGVVAIASMGRNAGHIRVLPAPRA